MYLYLVQHAEAKSKNEDPARGLSDRGLQNIRKIAQYIAKFDVQVSTIFHSDKLRAKQTAEVLKEYIKIEKGMNETDSLKPLDNPQIWFERVSRAKEHTMFIGHLPHLNKLASLLLCDDKERNIINFKMGGIVCLKKGEDAQWSVEWMITPEVVL
jgi:phosphohistidine phosphatase